MTQEQVKEIYLRVIDATIEGARAEFIEKGFNEKIETLQQLKDRWSIRFTEMRDFTDDPELVDRPSSSAKGSKAKKSKKSKDNPNLVPVFKDPEKKSPGKQQKSSDKSTHPIQNGKVSVENLTNANDDSVVIPRKPKSEIVKTEPGAEVITIADDEPPAKRQRREMTDEKEVNKSENLDSSDSDEDIRGVNEEDEAKAENFILAQHDRLRKGNKWKIPLREGIVHIRGKEYLFNKATCDLEF